MRYIGTWCSVPLKSDSPTLKENGSIFFLFLLTYLKNSKNWPHPDVVVGSSQQMAITTEFNTVAKTGCGTGYGMW
jgi:hypothetical protein